MAIKIYDQLEQGTPEWLEARAGLVTASTVGQLITKSTAGAIEYLCPKCMADPDDPCYGVNGKPIKTIHPERAETARSAPITRLVPSTGDTAKSLMRTLIAERITGRVEPIPMNRAMERGVLDEPYARMAYEKEEGVKVDQVGFITEDKHGFVLGYSPDGLVGDDGLIEIKSRDQKTQLLTILTDEVPAANMAQLQTGLLVKGAKWIDYVSYCGGMPLYVKRVYPDPKWFAVIIEAVSAFEKHATETISQYLDAVANRPATEYIEHFPETEFTF
ncbi:lambda exonuclease family protein [Glutamicibacter halophytocola]|uniref:lambda exonuclease family protein n=1 Tax=Glutamicibacter halophytocola TaxID=1933880 RepID=UPI000A693D55|nr:lambda exonuclease family protein [Glutamicibacter halophytocola]